MPAESRRRVPLTVRLTAADKDVFETAAERCGIDAGLAARLLMELTVRRLAKGDDLLEVLTELKRTWGLVETPT